MVTKMAVWEEEWFGPNGREVKQLLEWVTEFTPLDVFYLERLGTKWTHTHRAHRLMDAERRAFDLGLERGLDSALEFAMDALANAISADVLLNHEFACDVIVREVIRLTLLPAGLSPEDSELLGGAFDVFRQVKPEEEFVEP